MHIYNYIYRNIPKKYKIKVNNISDFHISFKSNNISFNAKSSVISFAVKSSNFFL